MKRSLRALGLLAPLLVVGGCASLDPITSCEPVGPVTPLCGFQNPEDLALLPDARSVLVSEYGGMLGEGAGALSRLDLETRDRRVLYTGGGDDPGTWGEDACPGPPDELGPHGLHLARRDDGRLQLLVVHHFGRESIEMFEVLRDASGKDWELAWRGCVLAPSGVRLNEVVGRPDGGFLTTHMLPKGSVSRLFAYVRAGVFGGNTGRVLEWQPDRGFREVAGTEAPFPNGLELSPDGRTLFLNSSLGHSVSRIDLERGAVEARASVPTPDNTTWAPDGRLWVASLQPESESDTLACDGIESGSCPIGFAIIAVDPETMETETVFASDAETPGGAGTVGLPVPGGLLVGTFAGDRILHVTLEEEE